VNRAMDPAVADVVESFCAVELYLPDYIAKVLPRFRASRGRAWFHAAWGYEESKHSLALGDWLLKSGLRSEEQMADLERQVFQHEWNLPRDSPLGMVLYGMVQELATWLNYHNLRRRDTGHSRLRWACHRQRLQVKASSLREAFEEVTTKLVCTFLAIPKQ
jgi:acyl-[acyl-carrier-protein] desaturase